MRYRVQSRGETPSAVMEAEGSRGPGEGQGGISFDSGKGVVAEKKGRHDESKGGLEGGYNGQQGVGPWWEALV